MRVGALVLGVALAAAVLAWSALMAGHDYIPPSERTSVAVVLIA